MSHPAVPADRARVLVYAPFSFNGRGPAESCAAIVSAFPTAGPRVELYAARFRRDLPAHVHCHPSLPLPQRFFPWRLVADRALQRLDEQFEQALASADPTSSIAYFWPDPPERLVSFARQRGIVTVREMINTACATSGPLLDAAYARVGLEPGHTVTAEKIDTETAELRQYDYFFASNVEVEKSLARLGVDPQQVLSTSFGWVPERLLASPAERDDARLNVLFVGTLNVRKGVPELLQAWKEADIDGDLILAGPMDPEIQPFIDEYATASVRLTGFVSDVGSLFRSADVFVFPTIEEGGPQVTYEAAGTGLPIITTPMGAARLVETGVNGIVTAPGSVDELRSALQHLASRPDLRETYGANAQVAAQRFDYARVGAERADLLLSTLVGGIGSPN